MNPLLLGFLLGLATIPAALVLLLLAWVAFRRSTVERVWCDVCPDLPNGAPAYAGAPSASRLPAWCWSLSWRAHARTPRHRAAYAEHLQAAALVNAARVGTSDAGLLSRFRAT